MDAALVLVKLLVLPLVLQGEPFTNPGASQPLYLGGTGTPVTINPSEALPREL